ncbi:ABC transporter ATP-binding protein [Pontibacter silvestris]|uniref:ABC transporter ATP-binding protein n=1 Tax=Pontibacter silvestris TaxID=2305183 RepID=A0ABW4WVV8_9BACT|nr:ABC transporter ATP-binding protein [Pontibacter silvestris]
MIRIRNATKTFSSFKAVDNISLDIKERETLVLLGTSGCGKTTTLKLINRLIELSAGSIEVAGKNIQQQKPEELRRRIGYVIQGAGLFPHYTVKENIAVVPRLLGWNKSKTETQTSRILEIMGLSAQKYLWKYPRELSGGQQQRVGLARALVTDPPVVLMDEPFGALDPITRSSILHEFRNLEALRHKTVILVTHDIQEAFELGDRICLMDKGEIQQLGTPKELVFQPANAFVRRFLQERRFQLQLQVLQLAELHSYLQPHLTFTDTNIITLPGTASVLEATQLLSVATYPRPVIALEATATTPALHLGISDIMAAVDKYIQTLNL